MKSIIVKQQSNEGKLFPKLMIHESGLFIVLMDKTFKGQVVYTAPGYKDWKVGEGIDDEDSWSLPQFEEFNGEITLSND